MEVSKDIFIALDLDGTLAERLPGDDLSSVGKPIKPMIHLLQYWLDKGYKVAIFTARVSNYMKAGGIRTEEFKQIQRDMIANFLIANGLPRLSITADKSPCFTHFVDDKAVEVVKNEGQLSYISFNRFTLL